MVTVVTLCIYIYVIIFHKSFKIIGGMYMAQRLFAMKYIKNNKRRIAVLVVSLGLCIVLTYMTNFLLMATEETARVCAIDNVRTVQYAYLAGSSLGIDVDGLSDEEINEQYLIENIELSQALKKYEGVKETFYTQVLYNEISMSIGSWYVEIPLVEKQEINTIIRHWGFELCEGRMPENIGEIVIDKAAMCNGGYACGDYFSEEEYGKTYKIVGVLESESYIGYGIINPMYTLTQRHVILSDGSIEDLSKLLKQEGIKVRQNYDSIVDVKQGEKDVKNNVTDVIGTSTDIIYIVIIVLMFFALLIVYIMYLRDRHNEWCLYCAIGYSRKEIYRSIMRELLFTFGLALVMGVVVTVISAVCVDKYMLGVKGIKSKYFYPNTIAEILCTYVFLLGVLQIPIRYALHRIKTIDAIDDDLV